MSDAQWADAGPIEAFIAEGVHGVSLRDAMGRPIAVVRRGAELFAVVDQCPHRGLPFSEHGQIDDDGALVCGWHAWSFCLENGTHTEWATVTVCMFPIRVNGAHVEIDLASPSGGGPWRPPEMN